MWQMLGPHASSLIKPSTLESGICWNCWNKSALFLDFTAGYKFSWVLMLISFTDQVSPRSAEQRWAWKADSGRPWGVHWKVQSASHRSWRTGCLCVPVCSSTWFSQNSKGEHGFCLDRLHRRRPEYVRSYHCSGLLVSHGTNKQSSNLSRNCSF